jgi:hypothetical protein
MFLGLHSTCIPLVLVWCGLIVIAGKCARGNSCQFEHIAPSVGHQTLSWGGVAPSSPHNGYRGDPMIPSWVPPAPIGVSGHNGMQPLEPFDTSSISLTGGLPGSGAPPLPITPATGGGGISATGPSLSISHQPVFIPGTSGLRLLGAPQPAGPVLLAPSSGMLHQSAPLLIPTGGMTQGAGPPIVLGGNDPHHGHGHGHGGHQQHHRMLPPNMSAGDMIAGGDQAWSPAPSWDDKPKRQLRSSPQGGGGEDQQNNARRGGRGGRGGRASFGNNNNNHHNNNEGGSGGESQTRLFVNDVPRELNTIKSLSDHFSQFGEITNVRISDKYNQNDQGRAVLQFRSQDEAAAAMASPSAVCGNRFIKVFWAKYDDERDGDGQQQRGGRGGARGGRGGRGGGNTMRTSSGRVVVTAASAARAASRDPDHDDWGGGPSAPYAADELPNSSTPSAGPRIVIKAPDAAAARAAAEVSTPKENPRAMLIARQITLQKELLGRLVTEKATLTSEQKAEIMAKLKDLKSATEGALKSTTSATPATTATATTPTTPAKVSAPSTLSLKAQAEANLARARAAALTGDVSQFLSPLPSIYPLVTQYVAD